jgi:hypothetical protein
MSQPTVPRAVTAAASVRAIVGRAARSRPGFVLDSSWPGAEAGTRVNNSRYVVPVLVQAQAKTARKHNRTRPTQRLIRHCRAAGVAPGTLALLERAVSGDPDGDLGFLDHDDVHDGFGDPPRLLTPTAVAVCGFGPGFDGDVRAHLVDTSTRCGSSTARPPGAGSAWSCGSTDRGASTGRPPRIP